MQNNSAIFEVKNISKSFVEYDSEFKRVLSWFWNIISGLKRINSDEK